MTIGLHIRPDYFISEFYMKPFKTSKNFHSYIYSKGAFVPKKTALLREAPLEIIINNRSHVLIMVTPQSIRELVYGFVFTEGLIDEANDIRSCEILPVIKENGEEIIEARIKIASRPEACREIGEKRSISYSSCGVCGKESYSSLNSSLARVKSNCLFSMEKIMTCVDTLVDLQPLYRKTSAAHSAICFDAESVPIIWDEDMGRHNALDKVIGGMLMADTPRHDKILFSSGRATLEMILKTARAGIPVFTAKSRPTSKAVEAAKYYNITLIDLAKKTNRIYTHARRIKGFA